MKRFSFVARLGDQDTEAVTIIQKNSTTHEIVFINSDGRLGFGIGQALEQLSALGLTPTEDALDMVIIAAMVNAGDTRVSRKINAQDGWTREIDLYVPVANPAKWNTCKDLLERTLKFLSGDRWRFIFRDRPEDKTKLIKASEKLPLDGLTDVCLFSGGLDSLIGAIDLIKAGKVPLLVSHHWDSVTSNSQQYLLDKLNKQYGEKAYRSMRVKLGFDKNSLVTEEEEKTQRARSFLFYSLAGLAASSMNAAIKVNVPENGLIALNVPLDPSRLGALSTRTAHPYFMARMNEILSALGMSITLQNPYRHKTKGEMADVCTDKSFLSSVVDKSMSCSSPAKARYKEMSPRHCGYCVPCLIRRASIKKGLAAPDSTLYMVPDLSAQTLDSSKAEGEHIRSFQLMVSRIQEGPELAKILVHKPGPLTDAPDEVSAYAEVFRRGVMEVAELLKGVNCKPS